MNDRWSPSPEATKLHSGLVRWSSRWASSSQAMAGSPGMPKQRASDDVEDRGAALDLTGGRSSTVSPGSQISGNRRAGSAGPTGEAVPCWRRGPGAGRARVLTDRPHCRESGAGTLTRARHRSVSVSRSRSGGTPAGISPRTPRPVLGCRVADPLAGPGDDGLPGLRRRAPRRRARPARSPRRTSVNSSNSGVWNGSPQPPGATMRATDTAVSPELTRPTYSSMTFPPGTGISGWRAR